MPEKRWVSSSLTPLLSVPSSSDQSVAALPPPSFASTSSVSRPEAASVKLKLSFFACGVLAKESLMPGLTVLLTAAGMAVPLLMSAWPG
jgi:hypothetical protein